jgi:hypothetical protein
VKEGEYGVCILYSCMKIEWNLLKLLYEGGEGDKGERWRG